MNTIRISTPGKWILLGEHSVIRERPALVFPLTSRSLELRFTPQSGITPIPSGPWKAPFEIAQTRLATFLREQGRELCFPEGRIEIESNLPMAAGLGSSAALAVAVARLAMHFGLLEENFLFAASLAIEDGFHGKSSGMDIAAVIAASPLLFQRGREPQKLGLAWQPKIFLCDSGERSSTSSSVARVENLRLVDEKKFLSLDENMAAAVEMARAALAKKENESFARLAHAIEMGAHSFREWDLISEKIDDKINFLRAEGAHAVKPTGSGGGGFILSLWKDDPPARLLENLFPLVPAF